MTPHLSELTSDRLTWLIDQERKGAPRSDWIRRVMRLAGIPLQGDISDGDIRDKLDAWVTDPSGSAMLRCLPGVSTQRRCNPMTVDYARRVGVNPLALSIAAKAIDAPASVDVGENQFDLRQVSATDDGVLDDVMVPLGTDVYWTGRHLHVRQGLLNDTVTVAAHGRPAREIVDHPDLADCGRIVGAAKGVNGFDVLEVEGAPATPWREMVADIVAREG